MKYRIATIVTSTLLICLMACDKEDCGDDLCIRGEWEWIQSTGGCCTITPETLGATRSLKIDDMTFEQFQNDSLIFSSEYEISTVEAPSWTVTHIEFTDGSFYSLTLTGSELTLSESCEDCYVHEYERK